MSTRRYQSRGYDQLRPLKMTPGVIQNAPGSVEICFGKTRIICTATFEDKAPQHAQEKGTGWLTAEYGMLPGSTHTRSSREATKGKLSGRTQEIQRLIGRSLRSIVDLKSLFGFTLWLDCDVLEADGGTRTASITGACVATILALQKIKPKMKWTVLPVLEKVAAVSVGIVGGEVCLDLDYQEDSSAEVDMNMVMTESGRLVEIQATAEGKSFSEEQLDLMRKVAKKGIQELFALQRQCLETLPKV